MLGMKPMAFGNLPQNGLATGIECLHYAMNLPTSVVITGCDTMERLEQALEAARTFQPLTRNAIVVAAVEDQKRGSYRKVWSRLRPRRNSTVRPRTSSGWDNSKSENISCSRMLTV